VGGENNAELKKPGGKIKKGKKENIDWEGGGGLVREGRRKYGRYGKKEYRRDTGGA